MSTFQELFSQHAGSVLARQFRFGEFMKEHNWRIKLDQGVIVFNGDQEYPVQMLGSVAEPGNEWVWCWADEELGITESALSFSEELRAMGEKDGIPEFCQPRFSTTELFDGHAISIICAGIQGRSCYFHGPYTGGAIYCLILGLPDDIFVPCDANEVSMVIWRLLTTFKHTDQKALIIGFLTAEGYTIEDRGRQVTAKRGSEQAEFGFDDQGTMTRMEV